MNTELITRLNTEADLCKNEGADDIASLLWEAANALEEVRAVLRSNGFDLYQDCNGDTQFTSYPQEPGEYPPDNGDPGLF